MLMPLGQDEMAGHATSLPDALFSENAWEMRNTRLDRVDIRRVIAGGYPEVVARVSGERRWAWFRSYVSSLLERDVRDLANIQGLTDRPRLLGLLAARSSGLLNMSELSRASGIAHTTLRRYLALLEATFLLQPLRPGPPTWVSASSDCPRSISATRGLPPI